MTRSLVSIVHRLRLAFIIAWILGFLLGQWVLLQTGWGYALGSVSTLWRILAVIVAFVALMFVIDKLWKRPGETRSLAREFIDALIVGVFCSLAAAK